MTIMKNTFRYLMAIAVSLAFASCDKALDKAEVEAGFAQKETIPTVTEPTLVELKAAEKVAVMTVTFADYSAETDSLELGFLVATDPTFESSKAVLLEEVPANGTVTMNIPVTPGKMNYVMATASSVSGTNFSKVVELDVPVLPWYLMAAETYSATFTTYLGYEYDHTIGIQISEDNTKMTFLNLDVSLASYYGIPHSVTGTINAEERTVTFEVSDEGTVDIGLSAAGAFIVPMLYSEEAEDLVPADSFMVAFSEDASEMVVQSYGLNIGGSWDDLYFNQKYIAD